MGEFASRFIRDKSLSELSTIGVGGKAAFYTEAKTISEMSALLAYCHENDIPYFILGKGSNTLFSDEGFAGLVIGNRISYFEIQGESVDVGAGFSFSLLGVKTAREGLKGLEFASGIPASVGGAVYMNAGANGQETKDTLTEVLYLDETGSLQILAKEQIEFGYRVSSFHHRKGAIVGARFTLSSCDKARENQLKIIDYRMQTQPYKDKSAGCIFRNPEGKGAGALIDTCGLKGKRVGGAEVSLLHANFIVNRDNATAADILALGKEVQREVARQTGVVLEWEVRAISSEGKGFVPS